MKYNLTVHSGLEDGTAFFELISKLQAVGQITVVGNRKSRALVCYQERLGVGDI